MVDICIYIYIYIINFFLVWNKVWLCRDFFIFKETAKLSSNIIKNCRDNAYILESIEPISQSQENQTHRSCIHLHFIRAKVLKITDCCWSRIGQLLRQRLVKVQLAMRQSANLLKETINHCLYCLSTHFSPWFWVMQICDQCAIFYLWISSEHMVLKEQSNQLIFNKCAGVYQHYLHYYLIDRDSFEKLNKLLQDPKSILIMYRS